MPAGARELIRLLRQRGFHIRSRDLADDSDDYEPEAHRVGASSNRHRHKRYRVAELPPVPNPEGRKLMDAGVFGSSRNDLASVRQRSQRLAEKLVYRELGLGQGYAGISACRYSQVGPTICVYSLRAKCHPLGRNSYLPQKQTR